MTKVADVMTREVITVTPETSLRDLAKVLLERNINGVPVVNEDGDVLGVVCESDLIRRDKPLHIPTVFVILDSVIPLENPWRLEDEFKRITATTVEEIYSKPAKTIAPDADISEAALLMSDKKYYTLPVVEAGRLVGILGKGDLLRSMT
jgi:CBS domain-containing protein